MAYISQNIPLSLFPTAPAAPNAFCLFGQNPRDAYGTYEELRSVLRPSNGQQTQHRRASVGSTVTEGIRKLFCGA
ncbi:hypothetical protein HETIRDRAFT_432933 [Heterobasidion irregulare TC 32-1]|uniref:Uncharacterized protein n=1 Tax=Heterobasidion irregulare (strain TC 32-1) TaxID=747525 RepID=W4KDT2_HETIT|nr:uncharacterized protein HETIRDRAFT_408186 [Heterobasidion irregulare TC 32-1]ETW83904.1 hypothetical protein HETIRDRAFT_432933 [Heterobasidion irregulare TC 32-1]